MTNTSKKISEQLGMAHGTAQYRLKKSILFAAIQQLGQDICYRCKEKIESIDEFSIDHKTRWMDTNDPVGLFFDLDNISFSHSRCNSQASRRNSPVGEQHQNSKLTDEIVREIHKRDQSTRSLAKEFGVSKSTIESVKSGTTWKHVATEECPDTVL